MLTAADWAILAVIGISALLSLVRGFIKEAVSLAAWAAAFVVAGNFYQVLAPRLTFFADSITRVLAAVLLLFVGTLLIAGTCGNMLRSLIDKAGLSGTDRLLGVAFGIVRGILIVCAILALLQILFKLYILNFVQMQPWWQQSLLIPELQRIVNWFFIYMGTPMAGA